MIRIRRRAVALAAILLLAGCSSPATSTQNPASTATPAPQATSGAGPTTGAAAGEPCSFLTAGAVGAIVGTVPVEVEERVGRGDCDYWLTAARDAKVNIGVVTGSEASTYLESIKAIGTPEAVSLGDEAFSIFNESIGTIVVARQGDSVTAVQVFIGTDRAQQLAQATALAQAVLAGL